MSDENVSINLLEIPYNRNEKGITIHYREGRTRPFNPSISTYTKSQREHNTTISRAIRIS